MHRVQKCGMLLPMFRGPPVCLCVCLLDITVSCAKTDERINMLFGLWTRVAQETMYYVGAQTPLRISSFRGIFRPIMKYMGYSA